MKGIRETETDRKTTIFIVIVRASYDHVAL